MADYEVTTHLRCPEGALARVLDRYERVLTQLLARATDLRGWLQSISWSQDGSGFVSTGPSLPVRFASLDGSPLAAAPHVLGYTGLSIPALSVPWIQLSLILDYDHDVMEYQANGTWKYRPGVGHAACLIMFEVGKEFAEAPVYFNDGPTVNEPWKALTGGSGNRWAFDLALVPQALAWQFEPLRRTVARVALPQGVGLARLAAWASMPWVESGLGAASDVQIGKASS